MNRIRLVRMRKPSRLSKIHHSFQRRKKSGGEKSSGRAARRRRRTVNLCDCPAFLKGSCTAWKREIQKTRREDYDPRECTMIFSGVAWLNFNACKAHLRLLEKVLGLDSPWKLSLNWLGVNLLFSDMRIKIFMNRNVQLKAGKNIIQHINLYMKSYGQ